MALSASIVWEVQPADTHADDANGGGFKTGATGTDYTNGVGLAHIDIADLETDGGSLNVMVSVGRNFVAADVGNLIHVISGSHATPGWYEVLSVAANKATVDRNWATEDNSDHDDGVAILGGALATPGGLGLALAAHGVAGMRAWIKTGTYTLANSVENTSGGPISLKASTYLRVEGYASARGDRGTAPTIDAGAQTSVDIFTLAGSYSSKRHYVCNIAVDGNSGAGNDGFVAGGSYAGNVVYLCQAIDCPGYGFDGTQLHATACYASGCGTGFRVPFAEYCRATAGTTGFGQNASGAGHLVGCLADNNSGNGFDEGSSYRYAVIGCTAYNNSAHGFDESSYAIPLYKDCLAVGNGGYGFNVGTPDQLVLSCSGYDNTSGNYPTGAMAVDWVTITGDPFVNAAGGDFRLNDTAGRGAALRGTGIGVYGQTDNRDVGAVQHTDPAGGGLLVHPGTSGGARG